LVNNLLQYSRPGEYSQSLSPLNINQVLDDTLLLVRHTLEKQSLQVKLNLQATCSAEGNVQQLQQVFVNLVINAANATQGAGDILIRSHDWYDNHELKGVVVDVEDYGRGIAEGILSHILALFAAMAVIFRCNRSRGRAVFLVSICCNKPAITTMIKPPLNNYWQPFLKHSVNGDRRFINSLSYCFSMMV